MIPSSTDAVFLTDLTAEALDGNPRHAMYAAECARRGLNLVTVGPDGGGGEPGQFLPRRLLSGAMEDYDRLHDHPDALVICAGIGPHSFAALWAFASHTNPLLLDLAQPIGSLAPFAGLEDMFPSFGGQALLQSLAKVADGCVAANGALGKELAALNPETVTCPSLPPLSRLPAVPVFRDGDAALTLGLIGRMDSPQRVESLLSAWQWAASLSCGSGRPLNIHLLVDGPIPGEIDRMLNENGGATIISLADQGCGERLRQLDLAVAADSDLGGDHRRDDGTLLTVAGQGGVICALRDGEMESWFQHDRTALLAETPDELRSMLVTLMGDDQRRRRLGRAAHDHVKTLLAAGAAASPLVAVLDEVLSRMKTPSSRIAARPYTHIRRDAWLQSTTHPTLFGRC